MCEQDWGLNVGVWDERLLGEKIAVVAGGTTDEGVYYDETTEC